MRGYSLTDVKEEASQLLSAGALSFTYTFTKDGWLDWVGIKFSGAVSQTVAVTFNSATGAAYDIPFDSTAISAGSSYTFNVGSKPIRIKAGDAITVTCTNATTPAITAYLTAMFTERKTWNS